MDGITCSWEIRRFRASSGSKFKLENIDQIILLRLNSTLFHQQNFSKNRLSLAPLIRYEKISIQALKHVAHKATMCWGKMRIPDMLVNSAFRGWRRQSREKRQNPLSWNSLHVGLSHKLAHTRNMR